MWWSSRPRKLSSLCRERAVRRLGSSSQGLQRGGDLSALGYVSMFLPAPVSAREDSVGGLARSPVALLPRPLGHNHPNLPILRTPGNDTPPERQLSVQQRITKSPQRAVFSRPLAQLVGVCLTPQLAAWNVLLAVAREPRRGGRWRVRGRGWGGEVQHPREHMFAPYVRAFGEKAQGARDPYAFLTVMSSDPL